MIFDTLLNAAYRVSLGGPEAELEGELKPPGPARSATSTGPARVSKLFAGRYGDLTMCIV